MKKLIAMLCVLGGLLAAVADVLPGFENGTDLGTVFGAWKITNARDSESWCVLAVTGKAAFGIYLPPEGPGNLKRLDILDGAGARYMAQAIVDEKNWIFRVVDNVDGKPRTDPVGVVLAPLDGYGDMVKGVFRIMDAGGSLVKQGGAADKIELSLYPGKNYLINYVKSVKVTVRASDDSMGSVTGGGEFQPGEEITLTAAPKAGYQFVQWENEDGGVVSEKTDFTVAANEDSVYIAVFEPATAIASVKIVLQPGWNLIGVPFVKVGSTGTLFDDLVLDPANGNARVADNGLQAGKAYWVFHEGNAAAVTLSGSAYTSRDSALPELSAGWNFVAPLMKYSGGKASFARIPAGSYRWEPVTGSFRQLTADMVAEPGVGYVVIGK